jgi:hypothetical protein
MEIVRRCLSIDGEEEEEDLVCILLFSRLAVLR